jgi:hypothetical protein
MSVEPVPKNAPRAPVPPPPAVLGAKPAPTASARRPDSSSTRQDTSSVPRLGRAYRPVTASSIISRGPRNVAAERFPALSGLAPAQALDRLEQERVAAEYDGRLNDAQDAAELFRSVADNLRAETVKHLVASNGEQVVKNTREKYRSAMFSFTIMWEEKMQDYEVKAREAVEDLQRRQQQRFEEEENAIRNELASRKPRYSVATFRKREEFDLLLHSKHYREADRLQRELQAQERKDEQRIEESLNHTLATRTKNLRAQQEKAMESLKQRIAMGRDDLIAQRRQDYYLLLQKHANESGEMAQRERTASAVRKSSFDRLFGAKAAHNSPRLVLDHLTRLT